MLRVTNIEQVVYKTPENHGDQTQENQRQEEDFSWQEEEDNLQDTDGNDLISVHNSVRRASLILCQRQLTFMWKGKPCLYIQNMLFLERYNFKHRKY